MAYNKMVDMLRRQRPMYDVAIQHAEYVVDQQPIIEQVEERLDFEQILNKLPLLNDQQRQVIMLRFVEGLSIAETAQIMQKSEGAIKGATTSLISKFAPLFAKVTC